MLFATHISEFHRETCWFPADGNFLPLAHPGEIWWAWEYSLLNVLSTMLDLWTCCPSLTLALALVKAWFRFSFTCPQFPPFFSLSLPHPSLHSSILLLPILSLLSSLPLLLRLPSFSSPSSLPFPFFLSFAYLKISFISLSISLVKYSKVI